MSFTSYRLGQGEITYKKMEHNPIRYFLHILICESQPAPYFEPPNLDSGLGCLWLAWVYLWPQESPCFLSSTNVRSHVSVLFGTSSVSKHRICPGMETGRRWTGQTGLLEQPGGGGDSGLSSRQHNTGGDLQRTQKNWEFNAQR